MCLLMVVSRCRGIGPPSSGIVLRTLFLLAADLRRHEYPSPLYCLKYIWLTREGRGVHRVGRGVLRALV